MYSQSSSLSFAISREHATNLDEEDPLKKIRKEFLVPTKADLKRTTLAKSTQNESLNNDSSIYICGNSLGLQPRRTADRVSAHLAAWATKGVLGHFKAHDDSSQPPFLHIDDVASKSMAPILGAREEEVVLMETLTANLHFMMASFYRPTETRYKIIMEGKAFPSDHYAIESQIRHHNLDPGEALVIIESPDSSPTITTPHILSVIDTHAASTALIILPGVQYYTGQLLDIETITAYAHSKDIIIGWDLAHAIGNVPLSLHSWNVDFAVWCSYKYLNAGPGAIAGLFVHARHGLVDREALDCGKEGFRPRLSGWWGGDRATRFEMGSRFVPIDGAAGYQLGNPSALALTALLASLEIFHSTSMLDIRQKSIAMTGLLEKLLLETSDGIANPYRIITPSNPAERGAQLSIRLEPGMLDGVMAKLDDAGVVVDERKPDVIRVAPAPLYNTFVEVWDFVSIFKRACGKVKGGK